MSDQACALTIVDSALSFTKKHNLRIFPLISGHPGIKRWPELATTDKTQIIDWFKTKKFDGFGVVGGISTLIIDVDVKNGKKGLESLKGLIKDGLPKDTLIIKTKSGGLHIYFNHSLPYVKSIADLFPGVDIRGTKGFVVGPDQPHYKYKTVVDTEIIDLPEDFQRIMPVDEVDKTFVTTEDLMVTGAQTAGGVIPDIIEYGARHDTLIRLMASWARKVPIETGKLLLAEAISRCERGKESVDYDEYEPRLVEVYGKYEPVNSRNMDTMLDTLIYVANGDRVYNRVARRAYKIAAARNLYKNAIQWKEETNAKGNTKKTKVQLFDRWMEHPDRADAFGVGFKPVAEDTYFCPVTDATMVNAYVPPKHEPVERPQVRRFIELVDFLWEEHAPIILDWCAHLIQQPLKRPHWAPVIITPEEGVGKNIFTRIMASVLGPSNISQIEAMQFVKSFNTFLTSSQLVVLNEVEELKAVDRSAMGGKLKRYITDDEQSIEGKGNDIYDTIIYCAFIIMSNATDAIQMSRGSRRYFVHVNECKPKEAEWYKYVTDDIESLGNHVYWYLMSRDVSNFRWYGDAPMTAGKKIVERESYSAEMWRVIEAIEHFESIFITDIVTRESWEYFITKVMVHRVSAAQARYIQKQLFVPVKLEGKTASRQVRGMPKISEASDKELVVEATELHNKITMWTCRRHGMYDGMDPGALKEEYSKIFKVNQSADIIKMVS